MVWQDGREPASSTRKNRPMHGALLFNAGLTWLTVVLPAELKWRATAPERRSTAAESSRTLARPTTSTGARSGDEHPVPRLQDCRWLDLCSGSGVMGCEALFEGRDEVVAIDKIGGQPRAAEHNLRGGLPAV